MKLGQEVYYIDRYTSGPGDPDEIDQFHHIRKGRYLSEDSETTALVTIGETDHHNDHVGGIVIFLPNDQVTEDDDTGSKMCIIDAILESKGA